MIHPRRAERCETPAMAQSKIKTVPLSLLAIPSDNMCKPSCRLVGSSCRLLRLTWPLPCLDRPLFLLFFDMLGNRCPDPLLVCGLSLLQVFGLLQKPPLPNLAWRRVPSLLALLGLLQTQTNFYRSAGGCGAMSEGYWTS